MAFTDPSVPQPVYQQSPDAQNPAAVAFANSRIHQMIRAHLLAPRAVDGSTDPTQVWRTLSASLAQNPQALRAFLAAAQPQQPARRIGIPDLPFAGMNTPSPEPRLRPQTGTPANGGYEPPFHIPTAAALVALLQSTAGTPYGGRRY